jgi:hypothetical protein
MPRPQSAITGTLPTPLFRVASSANPFQDFYNTFDYAIGGVPFRADTSPENPLVRSSAQFRKDQFDNGLEPGEQSLSGWWLRSQSSWHLGAGIVNSDVRLDESAEFRYSDSEGVDPWDEGQMRLLHKMTNVAEGGSSVLAVGVVGLVDGVLYADGDALYLVDSDSADEIDWGGDSTILSITTDGANWYAASADGIYSGPLTGTTDGSKLWTISAATAVIRWCKGRLVAAVNNALYELVPTEGSAPHGLPTATYTHPVTSWQWTGISEGPEAIYAIGYGGVESFILKLALTTAGALPTLTVATVAAELPRGELGTALYTYVGKFLCVGTSKGVRIAVATVGGDIEYGPLIPTPAEVKDFVAIDHFVYAGFSNGFSDETSGALRIDLAAPLGTGRYPYAKDAMVHEAGEVTGVTTFGRQERLVLAVAGEGLFVQSATDYEQSGWFETGRIRHNTLWPKLFKRFRIKADLDGPIAIASVDDNGNRTLLASVSSAAQQDEDLPINVPTTPQEFIQLRFTLSAPSGDATKTPVLRGYQVKSLPGGPRPRRYIVPLRCYDSEVDLNGVRMGYPGFALERLQEMEALDSAGEVVLFEDLAAGTAEPVTIEQIEFRQQVPPQSRESWGGVLTVELRTLN